MKSAQRDALLSRVRPTRAASGDFEPRLQLYNDAMEYGYVDETARCDLMLAKYDLLRSVQRIEQAKQTLTEVKPVTDLQKHQVLLRRLQELDSQKNERYSLKRFFELRHS